jgi:predicted transcriptional regulator
MLWGRCITIREHLDERNKLIVKGEEALTSREEAYNRMKEGLRRLAALERQF